MMRLSCIEKKRDALVDEPARDRQDHEVVSVGYEARAEASLKPEHLAVRCAIEVQNGLIERNAGLPPERRIEFRVGIHLGDVVEESDGDLMGNGVNIAARLERRSGPRTPIHVVRTHMRH